MDGNINNDEYVAELLKREAKQTTKKYELVGIDAFNPRRLKSGAPKPNTNFLRHIIRQTDSHNAALLAKEAEESHARLESMNREKERSQRREYHREQRRVRGRLTPVLSDHEGRRSQKRDHSESEDDHNRSRRRRRDHDIENDSRPRRHRGRNREGFRGRGEESEEDRSTRKSRKSHSRTELEYRHSYSSNDDHKRRKHDKHSKHRHSRPRARSRTRSRTRSRSPRQHSRRKSGRDRSRSVSNRDAPMKHRRPRLRSPTSDSDPLESIVGPLPPPPEPTVRSRGRGAHKANSMGIESRFSSTYDPSTDIGAASGVEDDWGDAVEAFRDHQRWKQQGADRLKAAGFTDEQVKKWEKGDEPNEDDVVWTRRGQKREWDLGKVVDEQGDVNVKVDFGRLT